MRRLSKLIDSASGKTITKNNKSKSKKQEKKIRDRLNGRLVAGSGSGKFSKGDVNLVSFKIEAKRTDKESLAVKRSWLDKITAEAFTDDKDPALAFSIAGSEDWIAVPISIFKKLIG